MDYNEIHETYLRLTPRVDSVPCIPLAYPETSLRHALEEYSRSICWTKDRIQGKLAWGASLRTQEFAVNTVTFSLASDPACELMPVLAGVQNVRAMFSCPHYADNFEFLRRVVWKYGSNLQLSPVLADHHMGIVSALHPSAVFPVYPMTTLGRISRRYYAPIAFNAGFFACFKEQFDLGSAFGQPIGLLVIDGKTLVAPTFTQGTFLVNEENQPSIEKTSMADARITMVADQGEVVTFAGSKLPNPSDANSSLRFVLMDPIEHTGSTYHNLSTQVCVYTRSFGAETLSCSNPRVEISVTRNCIQEVRQNCYGKTPIPLLSYVISIPQKTFVQLFGDEQALNRRVSVDASLPRVGEIRHAFSGGPLVIHRSQPLSKDTFYDSDNSLWTDDFIAGQVVPLETSADIMDRYAPRTAIGLRTHPNKGDQVVVVTVNGATQKECTGGISLGQLTDYMVKLGCRDALNLDGGGSSKLMLWGNQINDPGDIVMEAGIPVRKERPAPLAVVAKLLRVH